MVIFIGNFRNDTNEADLKTLFSKYGKVEDVTIRFDHRNGCWAFVEMLHKSEAKRAIKALNGQRWNRRKLIVNARRERSYYLQ